ncbi:MAG TPA: glutathione S-transferase family protein [Steroidobacteraceae bacterium]|nr:glutathione S-transferase family protein [Steroidobacteraceae bacterium]
MIDVYTWEPNANSGKPLLMLTEKGAAFHYHYVDIGKREQHSPRYLEINPSGTVPTIIHDGHVMTESSPALEYLDAALEGPALRPREPYLRWRMRRWIRFLDFHYCPALAMFGGAGASRRMPAQDPAAIEELVGRIPMPERRRVWRLIMAKQVPQAELDESDRRINAGIGLFEQALTEHPYLSGPAFGLADIVALITIFAFPVLRPEEVNDRKVPHLMDWLRRCHARPRTQAAFKLGRGWVAPRVEETRKLLGVPALAPGAAS